MSRQKGIRQALRCTHFLLEDMEQFKRSKTWVLTDKGVERLFGHLSLVGCVLKVDRELPIIHKCQICEYYGEGKDEDGEYCYCEGMECKGSSKWKLKAGYVAVEPLIGGNNENTPL